MDEDEYFYILDRFRDLLNAGGFNMVSMEVEETPYHHAAVEVCTVICEPDPKRPGSEIVKVVIQLASVAKNDCPEVVKADILAYFEDLKSDANKDIGLKENFEIGSNCIQKTDIL